MQLIIMSDTHGDAEIISTVKSYYPKADKIIHCGDSELPFGHEMLHDLVYVKGNCDRDKQFSEESIFQLANHKIYVTHGHLFNVKSSLMALSYRAQELGATIVCFGHSHLLGVEQIDGILYVNPGSLTVPRGRKEKTFIVATLSEQKIVVQCLTNKNEEIEKFEFEA